MSGFPPYGVIKPEGMVWVASEPNRAEPSRGCRAGEVQRNPDTPGPAVCHRQGALFKLSNLGHLHDMMTTD